MKLKATIITLVCIVAVAGVTIFGYCMWPAIHGALTGNAYYSAEQMEKACEDAYNRGCSREESLVSQINHYKDLVDGYLEQNAALNQALQAAEQNDAANQTKIANLEQAVKDYKTLLNSSGRTDIYTVEFYYNNELYHNTVAQVGSTVTLTNPESTNRLRFNGWTVNGVAVELDEYYITGNTVFVADVTELIKVEVNFPACNDQVNYYLEAGEYTVQKISCSKGHENHVSAGIKLEDGTELEFGSTFVLSEDIVVTVLVLIPGETLGNTGDIHLVPHEPTGGNQ